MNRREFVASSFYASSLYASYLHAWSPGRPRPTPQQLSWQRDELAMFLHFGVNTFTDREWGDGHEDPAIFNPTALDARQWARVARLAGFKALILTAKHHDGFCLWPTQTTQHSVAASPFRGGQGDVVREASQAAKAEGLKFGVYCSPWDRNASSYGDPRYNDFFVAQLTELLTRYGTISEVWFDGANGEGPNGRHQQYDWPRFIATVRRHAPRAVIFSDAGPDVRWIGNERGVAGDTCWSTIDPAAVPYAGYDAPGIGEHLQRGDPEGVWRPGETDVSIRPGWFWHAAEDDKVRTTDNLFDLYCTSVGRNSKLLLNVPPTQAGLLGEPDAAALAGFHDRRAAIFARPARPGTPANLIRMEEDTRHGQAVAGYVVEAADGPSWRQVSSGTTIGYCKIDRTEPFTATRVRVRITDRVSVPSAVRISLHSTSI